MSGSIGAAAKAKLVGENNVLSGLSGMTGVEVAYDMPRSVPREVVFGGDVGGPVELESFGRDGSDEVGRSERLSLQLFVQVYQLGQATSEAVTTRATAISAIVETYIALNGTLGGLANLLAATVEAIAISSWLEDDGATARVTLTIGLESHLT